MSIPFEQQKRTLMTAVGSVVRQTSLGGIVPVQALVVAVDRLLSQAGPGVPLDLAPLRALLLEWRAPEDAIAEALLALKSKEPLLGIPLVLPPEIEQLPEAQKQAILAEYLANSQPITLERALQRTGATPKSSDPTLPKASTSTQGFTPPPPTRIGGAANRKLLVGLGGLLLAGLLVTVVSKGTAPEGAKEVQLAIPDGLSCVKLVMNHGTAVCRMSQSAYAAETVESLRTKAEATKQALGAQGVKRLLVQTLEDSAYRGSF